MSRLNALIKSVCHYTQKDLGNIQGFFVDFGVVFGKAMVIPRGAPTTQEFLDLLCESQFQGDQGHLELSINPKQGEKVDLSVYCGTPDG